MNIIPKFQQGGSLYTSYDALDFSKPQNGRGSEQASSQRGKKDSNEDFSNKEFIKEIVDQVDGLSNEVGIFANRIYNILTRMPIEDMAKAYARCLPQIIKLKQNKAELARVTKVAETNESLDSPAITSDGKIVVEKNDRSIDTINVDTYLSNRDQYKPLTVSELRNYRQNDPRFAGSDLAFDIIENSISNTQFSKIINQAILNLGSTSQTITGNIGISKGKIMNGIEVLSKLSQEDLDQLGGSITTDGLYEYKIIDKSQLGQIKATLNYLMTTLSPRAKTWAALKMQNPNKEEAAKDLIFQKILGVNKPQHTLEIEYKGSMSKVTKGSTSSGGKDEDPKEGFWRQIQSGKGGTNTSLTITPGTQALAFTNGKGYGATPGPENNCSLTEYLTTSGVGYVREFNGDNITFGNIAISPDSFGDIMVNRGSGAMVITLPVDQNGKVALDIVIEYDNFKKALKDSGVKEGTQAYRDKVEELLNSPTFVDSTLRDYISSGGELTPRNARQFLVLEGIASSKARGLNSYGELVSFQDIQSDFIRDAGDDEELYNALESALSSKDSNYDLDYHEWYNPFDWYGNYDKVYKGMIYIPLSTNPIDAMNADKNDIKESTAQDYEEMQQEWEERNNLSNTSSKPLWQ